MIKEVEVEKVVEVERVVEVPVEREVVREIVREVPVDRVVEVEKLVGMREEEVEAMKQALQVQAEQERQRLLDTNLLSAEENARQHAMLMEQQERIGNEQAEAERAKAELAALEAKIMHGGEHVRDRVTRQQFVQGLSSLGIEPQASDLELLFAKYDDAGEGAVNYVSFCTDVDSTETFSDRVRMPASPVPHTTLYGGFREPKVHEHLLRSM